LVGGRRELASQPRISGEQAENPSAEPPPRAGPEQAGLAEVDPVVAVQVGLDQVPMGQEAFPRDFWACRDRLVPLVEPRDRVVLAAASDAARFGARASGAPPESQNFMAVSRSAAIHRNAVTPQCLIRGQVTLSAISWS